MDWLQRLSVSVNVATAGRYDQGVADASALGLSLSCQPFRGKIKDYPKQTSIIGYKNCSGIRLYKLPEVRSASNPGRAGHPPL